MMTNSMVTPTPGSDSTSDTVQGMNDEEEIRRAGQSAQSEGVGEVIFDLEHDDDIDAGLNALFGDAGT